MTVLVIETSSLLLSVEATLGEVRMMRGRLLGRTSRGSGAALRTAPLFHPCFSPAGSKSISTREARHTVSVPSSSPLFLAVLVETEISSLVVDEAVSVSISVSRSIRGGCTQ